MNKTLLTILAIVIVVMGVGYFLTKSSKLSLMPNSTPIPEITSQPSSLPNNETTSEVDKLKAGGSSYADPQGVFTVLYPSDYVIDNPGENQVRIFKRGESARPQGELTNGALAVIETITLEGKSLEQYVDERIASATADGTSEIVEPKLGTTVNTYPAFKYTIRGLGTFAQIAMQKDANSDMAIIVTSLVDDPQNMGYQQEIDALISTVKLLK